MIEVQTKISWAKNWGWYTVKFNNPEKLGFIEKTIKHRGFLFIVVEKKNVSE